MAVCGSGFFPQSEAIKLAFPRPSTAFSPATEALEEQVGNLSLGDDGKNEWDPENNQAGKIQKLQYPVRPGERDCAFYLRTKSCKFGLSCKFNHPPQDEDCAYKNEKTKKEPSERGEQIQCKYYSSSGGCKYGSTCKYSHPPNETGMPEKVELNFLGLPIRPRERNCPYYMRTGSCKFAANCRYNHPDPIAIGGCDQPPVPQNGQSLHLQPPSTLWPMHLPSHESSQPFIQPSFSPPWGASPNHGPANLMLPHQWDAPPPSPPSVPSNIREWSGKGEVAFQLRHTTRDEFIERSNEPESQVSIRAGLYKSSPSRFHYPEARPAVPRPSALSPLGLPLRPGEGVCAFYRRYGICKFGPCCKFDHPMYDSLCVPLSDNNMENSMISSREAPIATNGNAAET